MNPAPDETLFDDPHIDAGIPGAEAPIDVIGIFILRFKVTNLLECMPPDQHTTGYIPGQFFIYIHFLHVIGKGSPRFQKILHVAYYKSIMRISG